MTITRHTLNVKSIRGSKWRIFMRFGHKECGIRREYSSGVSINFYDATHGNKNWAQELVNIFWFACRWCRGGSIGWKIPPKRDENLRKKRELLKHEIWDQSSVWDVQGICPMFMKIVDGEERMLIRDGRWWRNSRGIYLPCSCTWLELDTWSRARARVVH